MPNNKDYSNQLLLDFHNQFSELYNQRQRIFIKILTAVIVIFSAYGIVLEKTLNATEKNYFNPILLPITTIFATLVMTYLNCTLIHQGWNIRKTQWIVNRIRENILHQDKTKIFEDYGEKKIELPDFYIINIISSDILKISITIITVAISNLCSSDWLITTIFVTIISIITELYYYQNTTPNNKQYPIKIHALSNFTLFL